MKFFEEYTYLGLKTHRSLVRHLGAARSEKVRKEHVGLCFVDDKKERVINSVSYNSNAREWIAPTSLVNDDGDSNSDVDYYLNTHTQTKKMIARYSAKRAVAQNKIYKGKGLWKLHKDKILENMLRRFGCHSTALSPDVAITVADAMTDSNFTNHSEIWQMDKEASEIQMELNAIHRTILGVKTSTCMSAVRHELGVKTQLLRANIASLKLRKSHFFDPRESFDTPYVQGPCWGPEKGAMHMKNGAK